MDEGFDDVGMVVAGVVDAVAGEEVEDDASVFGVELGAEAAAVLDVHAEEAEEAGPLGIDEAGGRRRRWARWRRGEIARIWRSSVGMIREPLQYDAV